MNKSIIRVPSRSRCLAVDDLDRRLDWFLEKIPNCTTAKSAQEAITTYDTSPRFDIIFLDHDAVSVFVEPTDPDFLNTTFWRFAQHLHREEYNGKIIIHSGNPVGANRMNALLGSVADVYVLPFGSFDIEVI